MPAGPPSRSAEIVASYRASGGRLQGCPVRRLARRFEAGGPARSPRCCAISRSRLARSRSPGARPSAALSARVTTVALDSEGGLAVTAADEHWARELHRSHPVIADRLNRLLGDGVVKRIEISSSAGREHRHSRRTGGLH